MLQFFQEPFSKKQQSLNGSSYPSTSHSCLPSELEILIAQEHLRQARYSFNLSLIIIVTGTIISFAGAGLLLSGKTTEGAVAAAGSAVSSLFQLQLIKDANDRLEKSAIALQNKK